MTEPIISAPQKMSIETKTARTELYANQDLDANDNEPELILSPAESFAKSLDLMAAGLYAEAKNELNRILASKFRPAAVHAKIGECCLQLAAPFEAIEHFEEACKQPGLDGEKEKLRLLDMLAVTYDQIGAVSSTIKTLEKMVAIDPDFRKGSQRLTSLLKTASKFGRFYGLILRKLITATQLEKAQALARSRDSDVDTVLLSKFGIKKNQLGQSLSEYYQCPFVEFVEAEAPRAPALLQGVKKNYFHSNAFIPLQYADQKILVLVDNPNDPAKQENIRLALRGADFTLAVALKEDINKFIDYFYDQQIVVGGKVVENVFAPKHSGTLEPTREDLEAKDEDKDEAELAADSIVVQMANKIIDDAFTLRASDIHIESLPYRQGSSVRFRIDGDCAHYQNIPDIYARSLISRLKILARLDIAEKRLPQDGKIKFRASRGNIELRVATLPTFGGSEDMVLRILPGGGVRPINEMGLSPRNHQELRRLLDFPYGLILVVGPTGSGKTTTLHGALNHVNRPEKKIWTVEDPVEIVQRGLRQVQAEKKIGLDFARVLRALLRADPDIIMVGETRDRETAKTVIEAALTGHLVFSTLHTNSAPETVTRLLGMEVDPYNFSDSLLCVLAQRLTKRLCVHCRKSYTPNDEEKQLLLAEYGSHPLTPLTLQDIDKATLFRPVGCDKCKNTGYLGRLAIHELLTVNDQLKLLIVKNSPVAEIREEAMRAGMLTLKQDGIQKILQGHTDLLKIRAVCVR